jgi:glycosyltransferase involved in cell wall biosynthesis
MRIGIISTVGGSYSWAGSEEMWKLLGLEALRSGHEVAVCLQESFALSPEMNGFREAGGRVFPYRHPNWWQRRMNAAGLHSRFGALAKWRPDVVCVSGGPEQPYWQKDVRDFLEGCPARQVPIIQGNEEGWIAGDAPRRWLRDLYGRAARIICVSQANAVLLERQLAAKLGMVRVLPNPIRGRLAAPLPWLEMAEGGVRFATVGRYEVISKGQDVTLEAFADPRWKSRDWHWTLYGSGPDEEYIRELVKYYGLERWVTLAGFERDFTKIWSAEQMHILCSRGEGLALALVESMFCGRPGIVSRSGGNHELLRDGVDGYVVHGTNSYILGEVLERAWQERETWRRKGLDAFERVGSTVPEDYGAVLLETVLGSGTSG